MIPADIESIRNAAFLIAQAASLNATIAGMVAENDQRKVLGHSMAYVEDAFDKVLRASGCEHNPAVETLRPRD